MSSSLRRGVVMTLALAASLVLGRRLFGQGLASGHEAFAPSLHALSPRPLILLRQPPPPIPELPPDKPAGEGVVWAPGYWAWDEARGDFEWVNGVWGQAPPGRRWAPGYWAAMAEGWEWVPGFWAALSPPPSSPPPVAPGIASAPNPYAVYPYAAGGGFIGGTGVWWWPGLWNYPYPIHAHHGEAPPAPHSAPVAPPPLIPPGEHAPHLLPYYSLSQAEKEGMPRQNVAPDLAAILPPALSHEEMAKVLESPMGHSFFHPELPISHSELSAPHLLGEHHWLASPAGFGHHLASELHEGLLHGEFQPHTFGHEVGGRGGHESSEHGHEGHGGGHGR